MNIFPLPTGRTYKIKQIVGCTATNVVHTISCMQSKLQYVGSTRTQFKVRFRNHKPSMVTEKKAVK